MEPEEEAVDARAVEPDIEQKEKAVDAPEAEAWHLVQLRAAPTGKRMTEEALGRCSPCATAVGHWWLQSMGSVAPLASSPSFQSVRTPVPAVPTSLALWRI